MTGILSKNNIKRGHRDDKMIYTILPDNNIAFIIYDYNPETKISKNNIIIYNSEANFQYPIPLDEICYSVTLLNDGRIACGFENGTFRIYK